MREKLEKNDTQPNHDLEEDYSQEEFDEILREEEQIPEDINSQSSNRSPQINKEA